MDLLNSSIEGQVFYYLNYIFFILSLILVIPQVMKIYRKELKFYQAPLVFLFFCLSEYLVALGFAAFGSYYFVAPGLFFPTFIFLFALIIIILFIDKETPKKYSVGALGVFLNLSLLVFLLPLMGNLMVILFIFRTIYCSGPIDSTTHALMNKKHDIIPIFSLISLLFSNIFGMILQYYFQTGEFFYFHYFAGADGIVIQLIYYFYLRSKRNHQNVVQSEVRYVPPQQITAQQTTENIHNTQSLQCNQPIVNIQNQQNNALPINTQPVYRNLKQQKPIGSINDDNEEKSFVDLQNQQNCENIKQLSSLGSINDNNGENSFQKP